MRKLAVVLSHPTQYYSPWFAWIAARTEIDLRVFYLWDFGVAARHDPQFGTTIKWDRDLLAGYSHEFVPNVARRPGSDHFRGLENPALLARLRAWDPAAVLVFGYNYLTHVKLVLGASWPLIFRGDSHVIDHPAPSLLKRFLLRRLYARYTAVTYVGQANRDYFRTFGVPESRLHFAPHCIDTDFFNASDAHQAAATALRASLSLGDRRVVLFAGKLVPAKQPRPLLDAFLALAPADAALVFVGHGEELSSLQSAAAARPDVTVRFLPFANQSEMPVRYLLADIFALPSAGLHETWGLAVNEAMQLGVPCLVSHRVGCQRDLVTDRETGWVFPADDHAALRASLARALEDVSKNRDPLRAAVARRISSYTYTHATNGLLAAFDAAIRET